MSFHLVPIRVRTGCPHEEGRLVRWGKRLVAVLVQLSEPHGDDAGKWIVEEGFELGDAAGNEVIDSLGEDETLFDRHLGNG